MTKQVKNPKVRPKKVAQRVNPDTKVRPKKVAQRVNPDTKVRRVKRSVKKPERPISKATMALIKEIKKIYKQDGKTWPNGDTNVRKYTDEQLAFHLTRLRQGYRPWLMAPKLQDE